MLYFNFPLPVVDHTNSRSSACPTTNVCFAIENVLNTGRESVTLLPYTSVAVYVSTDVTKFP